MEPLDTRYVASDPAQYETFMGRWSELLAKPFLRFGGIKPGDQVLDVGCGTGVTTRALAEAGAQATGIDASEPYLEGARQHRSHSNARYELGDIRAMRFPDGSFDACVSTLVLDLVPEVEQVVAEMRRVVRPQGAVAAAVPDYWGGFSAWSLVWDTGAVLDDGMCALRDALKSHPLVGAAGLSALWKKAGFDDVVEVPIVVDCVYASFADYWATFTSGQGRVSARLMQLPPDVRTDIERHVRAGYLAGLPDGPRSFPMMFRAVRGRK